MPTYEYACRGCGERREVVQSFSDPALTTCESCGGELRKVFSAAGLIFKGSGWHIKDYAGASRPAARSDGADTGSGGAGPGAAASTSAADAAPAAGASTAPTTTATTTTATTTTD